MLYYLENYLFMAPIFLILEIVIIQYYKQKEIPVKPGFIIGFQVLMCLLIAILKVTGAGGIDDALYYKGHTIGTHDINLIPLVSSGSDGIVGLTLNVVLFMPLGIALPILWKNGTSFIQTTAVGFLFSLLIEVSQFLNFRATDIDDLIMNTLGTMIGFAIYKLCFRKITLFQSNNHTPTVPIKYSPAITILIVFIIYFFVGSPLLSFIFNKIYGF